MNRPLVSIVMASFQRAHLLNRSLECYAEQEFNNDLLEIIVIDDHSTDGTRDLVTRWSHRTKIRATVLTPSPKLTGWRDCGAVLNHGIRASQGEYVLLTHPEVMPGKTSVKHCYDILSRDELLRINRAVNANKDVNGLWVDSSGNRLEPGSYACCPVYYMSPRDQELIDTVDWLGCGALAVREIEGFYDNRMGGHPDYSHEVTDLVGTDGFRIQEWESWVFGGCSRRTWAELGGMLETDRWGSVDVGFMQRRKTLGIPTRTTRPAKDIVVHQNHDSAIDVQTPRNEGPWVRELSGFKLTDPKELVYPAVNHLWG